MSDFSHLDDEGRARMVDVSQKPQTARTARASCRIQMQRETLELVRQQQIGKGDVLQVARIAGIMAAKQTSMLIPLCHPLELQKVEVNLELVPPDSIVVSALVKTTGQTGLEMEALTAASVAALTIYDMCKSVDRGMTINETRLEEKSGGASGHFQRKDNQE
ncbi:MAG: cyclic pyranopterin monophosphate synthase MoaC [Pirellulaceae bacterium]